MRLEASEGAKRLEIAEESDNESDEIGLSAFEEALKKKKAKAAAKRKASRRGKTKPFKRKPHRDAVGF